MARCLDEVIVNMPRKQDITITVRVNTASLTKWRIRLWLVRLLLKLVGIVSPVKMEFIEE